MTPSELTSARERSRSDRRTATLALLAFAMLIVSLDQYIVVVALPEIGRDSGLFGPHAAVGYQRLRRGIRRLPVARRSRRRPARTPAGLRVGPRALRRRFARRRARADARDPARRPCCARARRGAGLSRHPGADQHDVRRGRERNRAVAVWGGAGRGRPRDRRAARGRAHPGARLGGGVLRQRTPGRRSRWCSRSR